MPQKIANVDNFKIKICVLMRLFTGLMHKRNIHPAAYTATGLPEKIVQDKFWQPINEPLL
ncbi:hypothetical protein A8C56_02300 [Niabella ginsenosidivorans]|uniref:Uncharacterized protein n=1 Tax=Niabella ginsenosidivorans TaxID=1176587 RepID=A0A1A9HZR9_9BACT|nr:hypothetical protein A8C56_02300 [Niabella ginsenosidivorans]